jgi:single-strand DNA-binding protein
MLIGNLGKDPDVQVLEGNIAVAKFPLATTETFKDREVNWYRKQNGILLFYGGTCELAQNIFIKEACLY